MAEPNRVSIIVEMSDGSTLALPGGWAGGNPRLHGEEFRKAVEPLVDRLQRLLDEMYVPPKGA